jgi:hypothetical protein
MIREFRILRFQAAHALLVSLLLGVPILGGGLSLRFFVVSPLDTTLVAIPVY